MITVTYKDAHGNWKADGSEHLLLDQAKAHAAQYPEYKAWNGDLLLAHLFNADAKLVEHFHKVKAEAPTPVEEAEHEEIEPEDDILEEDDE